MLPQKQTHKTLLLQDKAPTSQPYHPSRGRQQQQPQNPTCTLTEASLRGRLHSLPRRRRPTNPRCLLGTRRHSNNSLSRIQKRKAVSAPDAQQRPRAELPTDIPRRRQQEHRRVICIVLCVK